MFTKMASTKMAPTLIFSSCLAGVSALLTAPAFAKDSFPLITYECNTGKDFLLITNTLLKDGKEKDFKYSDADGTYSPWDLVRIENDKIVDSSTLTKECKLSSGKYTVIIEPQIFNHDLDGMCGATLSVALTLLHNDIAEMERKAFEFHCTGNTQIITGVKVMGKTGEVKIRTEPRYKYY